MIEHEPAHILLIEDNLGDADLVKLRLVESKSDVLVNCVPGFPTLSRVWTWRSPRLCCST